MFFENKITTSCWTTINRRMLEPTKKDTPPPRAKEKLQQDGKMGAIAFKIKLHTCQSHLEGAHKTLCTRGLRERSNDSPQETEPDLLMSVWESPVDTWSAVASCRDRGFGGSSPGRRSVSPKSSWRRSPFVPPQSHQMGDPQTGQQLYQRSSHTVAKVLGPKTDFPTWRCGKWQLLSCVQLLANP